MQAAALLFIVFAACLIQEQVIAAPHYDLKHHDDALRFAAGKLMHDKYRLTKNPEADMNTTQLLNYNGYPAETYKVVTDDGYILDLFRIPHGRNNKNKTGPRPVVLLQHGMYASCDDWLLNPINESLAYILADAGADVWLSNSRGNIYARRHKTLSPKSDKFWDYSWQDMAEHDLPANINYVLNVTGQAQLYYIGHSEGTTIGFAQFGADQELGSKVKHFMAMAPIARIGNTKSTLRYLVPLASSFNTFMDIFGDGAFNLPEPFHHILGHDVCGKWGELICENVLFLIGGFNYKSFNASRMDVYLSHDPAGASTKDILHFSQMIKSKEFQKFDYGEKENLVKYGQKTPPIYDPKNIKTPVAIFRGGEDWLADAEDVKWLLPQLNVTHDVYVPSYEHLDVTWGVDAVTLLYPTVLKIVFGEETP